MKTFNFKKISCFLILYFISFFQLIYAAPDIVAENYAAANSPGIKSCTVGYDLLSGDIAYQQSLISSKLPYTLNYKAPLRLNISAAQELMQPESSTSGWSDIYQSSIMIQDISTSNTQYQNSRIFYEGYNSEYYTLETSNPVTSTFKAKIIFIRLPGEVTTQLFKEENGKFWRFHSADPIRELNNTAIQNLNWSHNLGEYSLNRSDGNLIVSKYGSTYKISSNSYVIAPSTTYTDKINIYLDANLKQRETRNFWWGSNAQATNTAPYLSSIVTTSMNLYRVESIEQKGRILKMQYDGWMNLTQVTDNYNNNLTLERKFHEATEGAAQTVDESRLVTKVSYANAGQAISQVAEFKYQSYDVKTPSTGVTSKVYALIESNSTANGKNTYVNTLTELGAMKAFVASKGRTADTSYHYPILKQVNNALDQVVRQWDVTQNYVLATNGTYSTAQTTLRSFTPNNSGTAYDNTSVYNDIDRSITTSIALGSSTGNNTIQTTLDTPMTEMITINSSGYPCLTSGKTPISSAQFYTKYGYLLNTVDANNITTNYSYDSKKRLGFIAKYDETASQIIGYLYGVDAEAETYVFDVPTDINVVTPELTSYFHIKNVVDKNGNITSQTQTSSQPGSTSKVTNYVYFSDATKPDYGLLASVDGPRAGTADKIIYNYDGFGNLASQSQTINGVARTTTYVGYNTFAQPERIVGPNGMVTQFAYNADGTIKTQTVGSGGTTGAITGQTTTYTYDALKRLASQISPDNEITKFQYNLAGQTSVVVLPNENKTTYSYFPVGIISSEVQTNSANTVFNQNYTQLDTKGRVAKQYSGSNANQLYVAFAYDNNGNLLQTQTAQGITNRWTYDSLNRVITHTDGMGNVDTKNYDLIDNIISVKDAVNAGSNPLTYRNGNVLTQEVNSDFGTKTYSYNEADQLTQRIHATRKCNYNNIDVIGRYHAFVCTANSGTAANEYQINDNYTYDQSRFDRLDKVTSGIAGLDVNTNYTYDAYDRITQKSQVNLLANRWLNTPNQSLNVGYGYSVAGKLTSLTLPSGRVVSYKYNSATGLMTGISLNNSTLIRSISYDGANRVKSWYWGASGIASHGISYNSNGLLHSIGNRTNNNIINYSAHYGYDADGRITSIINNNNNHDYFTYDANDRLTSEVNKFNGDSIVYTIDYRYDKNGNRIGMVVDSKHAKDDANLNYTYTGNKLSSLISNSSVKKLTYTENAELSFGPYSAAYDNGGRRKADHASNHYYYMNYNHKNERITRGYMSNNTPSNVVQYVYDEESHLIGEYNGNTPIVEYVWMGDKPVVAIYGSGSSTKIYYILTDHANTPRRLIDSSNDAMVWAWDSTAFGVGSPLGSITFNLRFPGQYYDVGTGHFYNHNRFYNPELGRYMEPDPMGLEGGLNPYSYCYQNPIMFVDPNGKVPVPVITGVIGGLAGGFASVAVQLYGDKGVNWKSVGTAVVVGAAAGAVSPWTAVSRIGATVTGSAASSAQYGITQYVNNEATTPIGYVASAGLGALGGFTAGALPKPNYIVKPSTFISAQEATRTNNNIMWNMTTTNKSLAYNAGGAAIAADPLGLSSFNIQLANNQLYSSQYKNYQIGNLSNNNPMDWTSIRGTYYLEPIRLP